MTPGEEALEIFGVYDRGVANSERIVLRAKAAVDLRAYALNLAYSTIEGSIRPIPDQFLWLGHGALQCPGWVFVYSGVGTPSVSLETNTKDPVQNLYWNRHHVILSDRNIFPALIRLACVSTGNGKDGVGVPADLKLKEMNVEESPMQKLERLLLEIENRQAKP